MSVRLQKVHYWGFSKHTGRKGYIFTYRNSHKNSCLETHTLPNHGILKMYINWATRIVTVNKHILRLFCWKNQILHRVTSKVRRRGKFSFQTNFFLVTNLYFDRKFLFGQYRQDISKLFCTTFLTQRATRGLTWRKCQKIKEFSLKVWKTSFSFLLNFLFWNL